MFCLGVPWTVMSSVIPIHPLAFFKDLIHLLQEDVLGTDQAKGKLQEMVSSKRTVESHKQTGDPGQGRMTSIHGGCLI